MTVAVIVKDDLIIDSAVIVKKFIGQPFSNLQKWMKKQKEYKEFVMEEVVQISKVEYEKLKERSEWLGYLEAAGVDNWEGMSYASELRATDSGDTDIE